MFFDEELDGLVVEDCELEVVEDEVVEVIVELEVGLMFSFIGLIEEMLILV